MPKLLLEGNDIKTEVDFTLVESLPGTFEFSIKREWKDPQGKEQEFNKFNMFLDADQVSAFYHFIRISHEELVRKSLVKE